VDFKTGLERIPRGNEQTSPKTTSANNFHFTDCAIQRKFVNVWFKLCCDRKSRAACAQSFALWQQATIQIGGARKISINVYSKGVHAF